MSFHKIIILTLAGIKIFSFASEKNNKKEKLVLFPNEWEASQFISPESEECVRSRQESLKQSKTASTKPINIKDRSIYRSSLFVISSSKL